MKRKEIKNLAQKIVKYETILQTTEDMAERAKAEAHIMEISSHVHSLEDMMAIDEMVQDLMSKS